MCKNYFHEVYCNVYPVFLFWYVYALLNFKIKRRKVRYYLKGTNFQTIILWIFLNSACLCRNIPYAAKGFDKSFESYVPDFNQVLFSGFYFDQQLNISDM